TKNHCWQDCSFEQKKSSSLGSDDLLKGGNEAVTLAICDCSTDGPPAEYLNSLRNVSFQNSSFTQELQIVECRIGIKTLRQSCLDAVDFCFRESQCGSEPLL